LNHVRRLGCDQMQGFLFSKPVPTEVYDRMVQRDQRLFSPRVEAV